MKRKLFWCFRLAILLAIIGCVYICVIVSKDTLTQTQGEGRESDGYYKVTEFTYEQITNSDAPQGVTDVYRFHIDDVGIGTASIVFHTGHQFVQAFADGELIYGKEGSYTIGKSPGSFWNVIPIVDGDDEREIEVYLSPVYWSNIGYEPTFYVGARTTIYTSIVKSELFTIILSMMTAVLGLIFIIYAFYMGIGLKRNRQLSLLGIFAVLIGIWKLTDLSTFDMIFTDNRLLSVLPSMIVMFFLIPFVWFIKGRFHHSRAKVWYVVCGMSLCAIVCSVVLQLLNIADIRETLYIHHFIIALSTVIVIFLMAREIKTYGFTTENKTTLLCLSCCIAGTLLDLGVYYLSSGAHVYGFGMIGFLIYVVILGMMSFKETGDLLRQGMQAGEYKEMAYRDQLTNVYNRTAFAAHTTAETFCREDTALFMMDLNELKKCNDVYGHGNGDLYLMESSKIITDIFGETCYRMGGDEFCAILHDKTDEECDLLIKELQLHVRAWNRKHDGGFQMGIACGYKRYDPEKDFDLGDTLRRADRVMYRCKFQMKHTQAG